MSARYTANYLQAAGGGGGTSVTPGAGTLTIAGYAPTIARTAGQNIQPGAGSLILTGYVPVITRSTGQTVSPAAGVITITGHVPAVARTVNHSVAPGSGSIAITGPIPTVTRTTGRIVQPGAGALTLTGYAPTVARTAAQSVHPGAGALALTGYAPTVTQAAPAADPRYARPASDVSAGAWTPSAGGSLYAMLDETTPSSADYITTSTASTCEIKLGPVVDPGTSSGQAVRYQTWSDDGAGLTVYLMQGAAQIASWSHASLPTVPTVFEQFLTVGQCDAITDYANLRFKFEKP